MAKQPIIQVAIKCLAGAWEVWVTRPNPNKTSFMPTLTKMEGGGFKNLWEAAQHAAGLS